MSAFLIEINKRTKEAIRFEVNGQQIIYTPKNPDRIAEGLAEKIRETIGSEFYSVFVEEDMNRLMVAREDNRKTLSIKGFDARFTLTEIKEKVERNTRSLSEFLETMAANINPLEGIKPFEEMEVEVDSEPAAAEASEPSEASAPIEATAPEADITPASAEASAEASEPAEASAPIEATAPEADITPAPAESPRPASEDRGGNSNNGSGRSPIRTARNITPIVRSASTGPAASTYVSRGDACPVELPYDVKAGDLVVSGKLIGVAASSGLKGEVVTVLFRGIFKFTSAVAFTPGAEVKFGADRALATGTAGTLLGQFIKKEGDDVHVRLNPY